MNLRFFSKVITYQTMFLFFLIAGLVFSGTNASSDVGLNLKCQIDTDSLDISHAKFSLNGKYVYVSSGNNIYKVSTEFGAVVSKFDNTFDPPITAIVSLDISANGNSLATHDGLGNIYFWDTSDEKVTGHFKIPASIEEQKYGDVTYSPDLKKIIAVTYSDKSTYEKNYEIVSYDLVENTELNRMNFQHLSSTELTGIQMSHNGLSFAFGLSHFEKIDPDQSFCYQDILIYNANTFEELSFLDIPTESYEYYPVQFMKFSFDDKYIGRTLKYSYKYIGTTIFDVITGNIIKEYDFIKHSGNFEYFKDSEHIVLCYDSTFEILNLKDDSFLKVYDHYAELIEISNNDKYVFISDSNMIHIFDVKETGIKVLKTNDSDISVSVSNNSIVVRSEKLFDKQAQITICDLLGRSLHSISSQNQKEITINHNLRSGFYLCNVVVGADVYSYRILINR